MSKTQFEYEIEAVVAYETAEYWSFKETDNVENTLKSRGKNGWECIGMYPVPTPYYGAKNYKINLYFKRIKKVVAKKNSKKRK